MDTIAEMMSVSKREARRRMSDLRKIGVIQPISNMQGGRSKYVHYRVIEKTLIGLQDWIGTSSETSIKGDRIVPETNKQRRTTRSPLNLERRTTQSPLKAQRGTEQSPLTPPNLDVTTLKQDSCDTSETSHQSSSSYQSKPFYQSTRAREDGMDSEKEETHPEMDTIYFMKRTWGEACQKSHRHVNFPSRYADELTGAESGFDKESYRHSWLDFLAGGSFDIPAFLRGIGRPSTARRSSGGFSKPEPRERVRFPAATAGGNGSSTPACRRDGPYPRKREQSIEEIVAYIDAYHAQEAKDKAEYEKEKAEYEQRRRDHERDKDSRRILSIVALHD
jgi:hypothetical protein